MAAGYFLGASRGLPTGVSGFFGYQFSVGIAIWLAASLPFVAVHTLLWTVKRGWHRPLRYLVATLLMGVPPFGIIGWASPITAAGILFPGWAWWGLGAMAAGLMLMTSRYWPVAVLVLGGFYAWSIASWIAPTAPDGLVEINTGFRFTTGDRNSSYEQHLETIALVIKAAQAGARTIVLPESAFGVWSPTTEQLWGRYLAGSGVTIYGGATAIDPAGYDNVLMEITPEDWRIIYRQRMPVPLSMWHPWIRGGAHAHFFEDAVTEFAGVRVAPLICYEQLLIWPVIQSMFHGPEVIVATGNGWWAGGTDIVNIQKASAQAWAALFGLPLVMAFNT